MRAKLKAVVVQIGDGRELIEYTGRDLVLGKVVGLIAVIGHDLSVKTFVKWKSATKYIPADNTELLVGLKVKAVGGIDECNGVFEVQLFVRLDSGPLLQLGRIGLVKSLVVEERRKIRLDQLRNPLRKTHVERARFGSRPPKQRRRQVWR